MHSSAPRPCFFIIFRARSMRYSRSRSQLTRCCQSIPTMPKFAVPMAVLPLGALAAPFSALIGRDVMRLARLKEIIYSVLSPLYFLMPVSGMRNIPLRQIRAVIAVCEEGSFTRAAERENATQSGISQHVAAVERTLGVKLFERAAGAREADAGGAALLQELRRGGRRAGKRRRGGAFARRPGDRRIAHRPDADLHPRGAGAGARRLRAALPGGAAAHRRRLQRAAHRNGARRGARLRGGAGLRGHHRAEVAPAGARPRNADLRSASAASRRWRRCGCRNAGR